MTAGSGDYTVTWKPNFRFPGQYGAEDQYPFVQNHHREYLPEYGMYSRLDPINCSACSRCEPYSYAYNNPLTFTDPLGLFQTWSCNGKSLADIKSAEAKVNSMISASLNGSGCMDCEEAKKLKEKLDDPQTKIECVSTPLVFHDNQTSCGAAVKGGKFVQFGTAAFDDNGRGSWNCGQCFDGLFLHEFYHLIGNGHGELNPKVKKCINCYKGAD